ncbi:MAG: peptidoglycan bridge formation glycyltransferase FemA/FemB family protein [Candidatus Beckwithbacteria bacterium]|nr:peptidoglycan bridge formation glycyltransferase FemA/FemB family protein [Candidatus Beckwithbacteria bacterium]
MFKLKPIADQPVWENFLLASDQVNFLQSWQWGQMHQTLGHQIWRLGVYQDNHLSGLIQLIKVKAKRATYLECPGGPVIDWSGSVHPWLFKELTQIARENNASFIRLRPNIFPQDLGLNQAPMHLHAETTWVLPLSLSEAELLKNMRKTTRYLIKKASKLGVEVSQSTDEKDIDRLVKLQQETVDRKHFVPFSRDYFLAELNSFLPDHIRLFKASYQGRLLAIAMVIFYGYEAVYHYSGSSNQDREVPASYLLQWEAIKTAKKMGLKRYNFWGYTDNPRHRFFGPSLFKKGFGGHEIKYLPAQDLIISPSYWLNYALETLRRKWRRL